MTNQEPTIVIEETATPGRFERFKASLPKIKSKHIINTAAIAVGVVIGVTVSKQLGLFDASETTEEIIIEVTPED